MVEIDGDSAVRLRTVVGKLARRLRPTVAGAGADLTPMRISVLFTVVRRGPLGLSRLAELEALNPTMLSRVIAQLAAAGLVERLPDPADRRAAVVEATPAGRALRERIQRERNDVLAVQLGLLAAEQRADLDRALPVLEALAERLNDRPA